MRALSFLIVAIITFAGLSLESSYVQQDEPELPEVPEQFVLLYTFDEETVGTAKDLSGKGNDGQITDAQWAEDGKYGGGMEFNGKTNFIEIVHDLSLVPGGDQITVMAWLKPFSLEEKTRPAIVRKGWQEDQAWGLDVNAKSVKGYVYMAGVGIAGKPTIAESETTLALKEWHHLAMTYDGAKVRLYINGEMKASAEVSGDINPKNAQPVFVGTVAKWAFLHGIMDELAVLNVALTDAQIRNYMKGVMRTAVEASGKLAISWGEIRSREDSPKE